MSSVSIHDPDDRVHLEEHSGTMMAYTQGYLLALEDIMKDAHRCLSLQELLITIERSCREARQTLETIERPWPQPQASQTHS